MRPDSPRHIRRATDSSLPASTTRIASQGSKRSRDRKSKFELLEERRLLTVNNANITGPTITANLASDWAAGYPLTPGTPSSFSGAYSAYSNSANNTWSYGTYDSGVNTGDYQESSLGNTGTQHYTFSQAVQPNSFDSFYETAGDGTSSHVGANGIGGFYEPYTYASFGYAYGAPANDPGVGSHADHNGASQQVMFTGWRAVPIRVA